jgi:hypothetical protein
VNSPPPKPEIILTNFFAESTVLFVPITSRVKLCPSSPIKSRNEVEWDKCIICQVSTPELLIEMRNVSKNSLIEAMEARRDGVFF